MLLLLKAVNEDNHISYTEGSILSLAKYKNNFSLSCLPASLFSVIVHMEDEQRLSCFSSSKCLLINISAAYLNISMFRLLLHCIVFKDTVVKCYVNAM